jgi:hypothetical protein
MADAYVTEIAGESVGVAARGATARLTSVAKAASLHVDRSQP